MSADEADLLRAVLDMLTATNREMENYRRALLDPGGALDRLRTDMSTQIRGVTDHVTDVLLRVGAIEKPPRNEDPEASGPFKVLVVDDEPSLLATFPRILTPYGFDVHGARSGREALALVKVTDYDVVLCDLYMPGNGSTLCEHMVEKHPETSVVLMTGAEEREAMRKAIELGVVHCLLKPFANEIVVLTLRAAARLARERRSRMKGML